MHLVNSTRLNKNQSNQALMGKNFCIIEIEETIDEKYKTTNIDQSIKFVTSKNISSRNETKSEDKAPNKNTNDKNKSDRDDNRISEIQQGIDFEKDKLKEYYKLIKSSNKIHKDILALQENINNLENVLLRKEFGDSDKIIET
ncbi:hypothetical protein F8M41_008913 [Gigaspora margarita]|uniref:Uncharacterized protein n=1 Tax=Gigaspora margarita TaxID=4874 RepID=A0A8H3X4L2_GIGMA|nr:hypothetical protein F8M41_008913 [Gigaspora margarita]